jgi:alpha-N-acetylglucosaminidase
MLHNFGGNTSLYGRMDHIAKAPVKTLQNKNAGNMAGIGLTPEAIEQNPVIYELMLDNIWTDQPVDVDKWLPQYINNRYGKINDKIRDAWEILRKTVYADSITNGGTESIIVARPTFSKNARCVDTRQAYDTGLLVDAWTKMVEASDELKGSDEFRYDLVDLSRQVLADYGNQLQQGFANAYKRKEFQKYDQLKNQFLQLLDDMDRLLATRKEFLLGSWLEAAKAWGTTPEETKIYEQNARNLITLWGDKNARLHEYSWRHWSGLISQFYKVRWEKFFSEAEASRDQNKDFNQKKLEKEIASWEWDWVNSHDAFPTETVGDEIEVVKSIYKTYRPILK